MNQDKYKTHEINKNYLCNYQIKIEQCSIVLTKHTKLLS